MRLIVRPEAPSFSLFALACLAAAALLGAVGLPLSRVGPPARAGAGEAGRAEREWPEAPAGLREAFERARYGVEVEGGGEAGGPVAVLARNPAQQFLARFEAGGLSIEPSGKAGAWRFGMSLEAYGYGGRARPVEEAVPSGEGERVEYRRGPLVEWYINERRGVEQGFTLSERPEVEGGGAAAGERLVLRLRVGGGLRAEAGADGRQISFADGSGAEVLLYDHLAAYDAGGRELASRMSVDGGAVLLEVDDAGAQYPLTVDPLIQQARLQASDAAADDFFGESVAFDGNTAVVGSWLDDHSGMADNGSAYVFVKSGATWALQRKLTVVGANFDLFGYSVAIEGDTVVVGAPGDDTGVGPDAGSAFVFTRSGTTWTPRTFLLASDDAAFDNFGYSVAIEGGTVVIGAPRDDIFGLPSVGSAYVFTGSGATWTEQQKLEPSDFNEAGAFGYSVAVDGDTAVVGAPSDDVNDGGSAGFAYVFVRSEDGWFEQQKLEASDAAADDRFGFSVAVDGDTAVIGAPGDDFAGGPDAGSAYVFVRSEDVWSEQQKLEASGNRSGDIFGYSVAIEGDMVVVGAPRDEVESWIDAGAAYVFNRSDTTWAQQLRLQASDAANGDNFGDSVAIDNYRVVVGAPADDHPGKTNAGSAYAFDAGMEITKKDSTDPVPVGTSFNYELRVYNRGPLITNNVTVTDPVPAGLTVTGVSMHPSSDFTGTGCSIDSGTNTVNCDLGTMRVFDDTSDGAVKKGKAVIIVNVTATQAGQYTNEATVSADEPDPDMTDNTGRQKTTVLGVSSVAITVNNTAGGSVAGGAGCGNDEKALVRVTLTGVAPFDTFVSLSDDLAATTNIPASTSPLLLRVPQGQSSATLLVGTVQVSTKQEGEVTASYGTSSASAPLAVNPVGVKRALVSPASPGGVVGGAGNATATVNLRCTPSSPVSVTLSTDKPSMARFIDPATNMAANSVTVQVSTKQPTFTIETYAVSNSEGVTVTARGGDGVAENTRLNVLAPSP